MAPKALNIPQSELRRLYLKEKLSTGTLATIYKCNHVTILNYLNKYHIPRRSRLGTRKPITISKQTLYHLYHKDHLTQKQIAKKFGHSPYGIQRWMKIYGIQSRTDSESHTKFPKSDYSGNLTEKAYLIGFRLGDLNISLVHKLIHVRCSTTIKDQVTLLQNLFEKYGHVHVWKAKRGTYEISILLNKSFNFLLPKRDAIEPWIIANTQYFLSFLAGYSDAEGSYYLRKPRPGVGKVGWGMFEIETYDKGMLSTIYKKLRSFDIGASFSKSRHAGYEDKRGVITNKDCWRITVHKKQSLWNFIKLIQSYHKHEGKLRDLQKVKENLLSRNTLPYCKPIIL